ncbi:hypothetical protein MD484_g2238, partial [Candolleomyces efflorescens]
MSISLFQNASHFSTGDVNVNIHNNSIQNYWSDGTSDALELLLKHTTPEATHESVTYSYGPTCHPSTRKIIKNDIMDFINTAEKPCLKLALLSGPAGAGKSCIQRTIVEECLAQDIPTFSFFFGRDFGRDNADGAVLDKISFDPSIFEKSLIRQIHNLVLDPLTDICDLRFWTRRKVIIVDGLDECKDSAQRLQVIQVLRTMTIYFAESFRVILSSRPEFDILTAFAERPLASITRKFLLHNYDSDEDIMAYLVEEFARIRRTHPARRRFRRNWPTQDILATLVKMATQQFIFVSTVIRYIEDRFGFPDLLLEQVLTAVSVREPPPNVLTNPFAELDALYTEILHSHSIERSHLRLILHAIPEFWRIVETNSLLVESGEAGVNSGLDLGPTPWMLDSFFGFTSGTTDIVLSQFHALIHTSGKICFYHKSMEDYLRTSERSGDFFQSEGETAAQFLLASVKNLQRWSHTPQSPTVDEGAAFAALYICVRFSWKCAANEFNLFNPPKSLTDVELSEILGFDLSILLGWILLYGRRLWPNPNDMLKHMKPQDAPLEGLKDHWLDPIAEGVKMFHTCERSRLRKWKNKCPPLCKIVRVCCGNSRSVFSFLEEHWYLDKREKIGKLEDFDRVIFSGSSTRRKLPFQVDQFSRGSFVDVAVFIIRSWSRK